MSSKEESLKDNGSYNRYHMNVNADIFKTSPFFDVKDLVQVKYEMLRAVAKDGGRVTDVAEEYGFSRKTYYQIFNAFEEGGLNALMPKKTGPKGPSKLQGEISEFIDTYKTDHKNAKARATEIAAKLEERFGVRIHIRTIERYFEKKTNPLGN
jgi:transposase